MTRSLGPGALLGLLLLCSPPPGLAQAGNDRALVDEVAGINQSLERLVALLETSIHNQQADLLLKRIDLRERRLAPAERSLRSARDGLVDGETELSHLHEMLERERADLQRQIREGSDLPGSPTRGLIAELESVLRTQEQRRESMIQRTRDLEDELAEGRERIEVLEEMLQELLE